MELCGLVWTRYTPQNTLYIALFQLHLLVDPVFECGGLHLRDTNKGSMMRRAVATLTRRVYYSPAGYEGSFRGTAVVDFLERSPFSTAAASRRGTRGDLVDVLGHRNEQGQLAPQVSKQDLEQRSSMSVFNATELAYGMYHIHDAGVGSSARPLLHGMYRRVSLCSSISSCIIHYQCFVIRICTFLFQGLLTKLSHDYTSSKLMIWHK